MSNMVTRNHQPRRYSQEYSQYSKSISMKINQYQQISDSAFKEFFTKVYGMESPQIEYLMEQYQIDEIIDDDLALEYFLQEKSLQRLRKNWPEEDKQLMIWLVVKLQILEHFSFRNTPDYVWDIVASMMKGRTGFQCKQKFLQLKKQSLQQSPWIALEDQLLACIIKKYRQQKKENKWCQIANELNTQLNLSTVRTGKQCRERWNNHLNPEINRQGWTIEEDLELLNLVDLNGKRWALIAKSLKDLRNENAVKNRYNCLMKKNVSLAQLIAQLESKLQSQTHEVESDSNTKKFTTAQFEQIPAEDFSQLTQGFLDMQTNTLVLISKQQLQQYLQNKQSSELIEQPSCFSNMPVSQDFFKYINQYGMPMTLPEKKAQFNFPPFDKSKMFSSTNSAFQFVQH